jgi:hypothetical protein
MYDPRIFVYSMYISLGIVILAINIENGYLCVLGLIMVFAGIFIHLKMLFKDECEDKKDESNEKL